MLKAKFLDTKTVYNASVIDHQTNVGALIKKLQTLMIGKRVLLYLLAIVAGHTTRAVYN